MSVPVYDQLRALVLSDEFGPDTMLVETALATRLGVSRTPIREALRRLEQDGLVERTSRGTRVVERSVGITVSTCLSSHANPHAHVTWHTAVDFCIPMYTVALTHIPMDVASEG